MYVRNPHCTKSKIFFLNYFLINFLLKSKSAYFKRGSLFKNYNIRQNNKI